MLERGSFTRGALSAAMMMPSAPDDGPVLLAHYINNGTNLPTTSRTTTLWAADHEGVYRDYRSGEVAIEGGRQVRNLLTASEDFSDAAWGAFRITKVGSVSAVGPSGEDAYEFECDPAVSGFNHSLTQSNILPSDYTSRKFIVSALIRLKPDQGYSSQTVYPIVGSLDSTDADQGGVSITESWQLITAAYDASLHGSPSNATGLLVKSVSSLFRFQVVYLQAEDATGRSDLVTPSEYVSSSDGMKTFATANGNTVASNVVTEATGSALSPEPYVVCQPAGTNSCQWSGDISQTGWTTTGLVKTQDQVDIFGASNSAWTVEDDNGAAYEFASYALTIANNSNTNTFRVWIKKTTSAASFPGLRLTMTGGTGIDRGMTVNTDSGSLTAESGVVTGGAPTSSSIDSDGDWWRITMSHANNSTGNTTMTVYVYPAVNADASGTWDATDTGSCVMDQVEAHLSSTHSIIRYLGPIPTNGSAATSNATEPVVTWPSGLVNDFVVTYTAIVADSGTTAGAIELNKDNNNKLTIGVSGDDLYSYNRTGGGDAYYTNTSDNPAADNVAHTVWYRKSSTSGIKGFLDASSKQSVEGDGGTPDQYDYNANGVSLALGKFNGVTTGVWRIKDIKIYSVPATISDAEVLAL